MENIAELMIKLKRGEKCFFFHSVILFLFKSTLFILSERENKSRTATRQTESSPRSPGTPDVAFKDQKTPIVLRLLHLHVLLAARRATSALSRGPCGPISPVSAAAEDWISLSVLEQRASEDRREGKGIKDSQPITAPHRCQMAAIRALIRM